MTPTMETPRPTSYPLDWIHSGERVDAEPYWWRDETGYFGSEAFVVNNVTVGGATTTLTQLTFISTPQ